MQGGALFHQARSKYRFNDHMQPDADAAESQQFATSQANGRNGMTIANSQ